MAMAETALRQMIATCLRDIRAQTSRYQTLRPCRRRELSSAVYATQPRPREPEAPRWQAHKASVPASRNAGSESLPPTRSRLDKLKSDSEPRTFSSFLTDNYAREHNYLRISVTERCNLRCLYCMPEEGIELSPTARLLTTPEIVYLSEVFVNQGVDKIRLTGGEPTVRKDIADLMRQIGDLRQNGLKELCITTNGIALHRKLDSMVESGLTGVNLSLDTLDPHQFAIMTRRNGHEKVMKSINRILEMNRLGAGIKLKINCVVMRGLNEHEIVPFVEMGKEQDLEVRFIEYMPFDGNKWSEKKMLSFQEMLALIRQKYPDVQKVQDHKNDTSKTYKIPGFAGRIGFITSMTHNFCGTCNRLRITSDGNLKVCLFGNTEVSLRDILRESNNGQPIDAEAMDAIRRLESGRRHFMPSDSDMSVVSKQESRLLDVIGMAVKRKKEKHAGIGELENMKNRPMILIGG
jgi:GTP 3',8-cyclase